ncbi:MAG: hypothetical protein Q7T91_11280 [Sulfuricurvum sp.]|nr:hypothetical protein [Sulfuricurvum sp.]
MQKELINNLIDYINCHPLHEEQKQKAINILHKHQNIEDSVLFLKEACKEHTLFNGTFNVIYMGLMAISDLEEKETSTDHRWITIRRLEKDRKNIIPYINSLEDSLKIYLSLRDKAMVKRTLITLSIFQAFLKNDELTIEKLALISFHRRSYEKPDEFDAPPEEDPYEDFFTDEDGNKQFSFYSLRDDLKKHLPEIANYIEDFEDFDFLASLSGYFWGYRLTPQMILKSIAIKLYNEPFWIYWFRAEQINKSALKKSIEALLIPFSKTEKFTFDASKAKNFYVKMYYYNSPILALEGKNKRTKYQGLFNPDKYYDSIKDRTKRYDSNRALLNSMFFTN